MNVLVLSDNSVLERAKPIFQKRRINRWTFTDSDSINPKKDFKHIFDNYDLIFSLHCKKIFPKVLTDSVRCINIHPGFNPFNRGVYPHVFSIIDGLPAGATIHEMDSGIDTGPIIIQQQVQVEPNDTSTTLYKRVIDAEMNILDIMLDRILDNDYKKSYPLIEDRQYNSMKDFKNLCRINPIQSGSFAEFYDLLRALSHVGYMNASMNGIKFKLIIDNGKTD